MIKIKYIVSTHAHMEQQNERKTYIASMTWFLPFNPVCICCRRGFKSHLIPLSSEFPTSTMSSSIPTTYKEPFDQVIQRILQRSSSNPRIKFV